ncbi:MAG: hypothetical protein DIU52_007245 [bacterium]|nr:MAG: hypothetical protein DIU52_11240 [bacterium]
MNVAVGPLPVAGAASSPGAAAPEARPPGGAREPGFSKALSGALSRSAAERPRGAARAAPGAAGSDEAGAPAEDRRRSVEAAAGAVAALIAQMAPLSENPPAEAAAGTGAGVDAAEGGAADAGQAAHASSPEAGAVPALGVARGAGRAGSAADERSSPASLLDRLDPVFRSKLERVQARMAAEFGHRVEVVEGYRDQARQDMLYAQGRTMPGPVVTWTRNSLHTVGRAADVIIDGSYDNPEAYERLAQIAREEGLRTLGPRDAGHIELPRDAAAETHSAGAGGARVAQVAEVARVASVARVAQPAEPAPVAAPAAVAAPGVAPAADAGTAAPSGGRVPAGLESVARVSSVLEAAGAAAARPRSHVLLDVRDAAGNPTRIRVDLRGSLLAATIDAADPAAAERMAARLGELHRALERQGIENTQLRVRAHSQVGVDAVRAASGAESITPMASTLAQRGDMTGERRPPTPDTSGQHGSRDPDGDLQRSRREQRQGRTP